MKKVLIYGHRKCDDIVFDISTKKLEDRAFRKLFLILKRDWQCYVDLEDKVEELGDSRPCEHCNGTGKIATTDRDRYEHRSRVHQRELYLKAKKGDVKAMKFLLQARKDYEYEGWHITTI